MSGMFSLLLELDFTFSAFNFLYESYYTNSLNIINQLYHKGIKTYP